MSEPFIEKRAMSRLSYLMLIERNTSANLILYVPGRPDREPSRIPIKSLKLLKNANKSRKVAQIHTGGAEVEYYYCIT